MRLFVAVWPSPEVAAVLQGLDRPDYPSVRWTAPQQWHVTLRFVGDVAEDEVPGLVQAVAAVRTRPVRRVTLGPATGRLGRHVLMVPVAGVEDLGRAAAGATRPWGPATDDRPFTGHLTLARGRGQNAVPAALGGQPLEASWDVTEVAVVRSHLSSTGARYETIATIPLTPAASARNRPF